MTADKTALLACIRSFRREVMNKLDYLEDELIRLGDAQNEQPVQIQDSDAWMTAKEVCACLKISTTSFYDYIRDGMLPEGVAFGPRSKRWKMSDIQAWQKSKIRNAEEQPKTTVRRRGRVSRVRRIEDFCRV